MLLEQRIDLANMLNFSLAFLANEEGHNFDEFEQVWVVDESKNFYIALNINTDPEVVEALHSAFSRYQQQGRLEKLQRKYLGTSPISGQ